MVLFDTLKFSRKLEDAGFSHEQATGAAEAFSEVVSDGVATKADIRELATRLDNKIETVKAELKADVRELKSDLNSKIDQSEIRRKGDMRLVKWMFAVIITAEVIPLLRDFFS